MIVRRSGFSTRVRLIGIQLQFLVEAHLQPQKLFKVKSQAVYTLVISYAVNRLGSFGGSRLTYRKYLVNYLDIQ